MVDIDAYCGKLTTMLKNEFGERLRYVGLQGSYLRGEANEHSDIDIMLVLDALDEADLDRYKKLLASLEGSENACGFVCGTNQLAHRNPLEICQLVHTTKDLYGELTSLIPACSREDEINYVRMSLDNLYHELCHRRVHSPAEQTAEALPAMYKAAYFILQNLHFLRSGSFVLPKAQLARELEGDERQIIELCADTRALKAFGAERAFSLLFGWCADAIVCL